MEPKGEPRDGAEELPEMDGLCDACEPDEAQPATQVCHACSFAFCPVHADRHAGRTRHPLTPYSHEATRGGDALGADRGSDVRGGVGDAAGEDGAHRWMAPVAVAVANAEMSDGFGGKEAPLNGLEGAEAGQEATAAGETGKRDAVTVERLRCTEHGQEGALYCKTDEKIVCVVCAVRGEHREHEIITLREAYVWQKSRQGYDLLGCTQQMAEKIKTKWTNPEMSTDELEAYVNDQFDELRTLVHLEERRTLHLVDLKEASLTASAAEKIAEIGLETERLQEEMASITNQLCLLEQAGAGGPAAVAEALIAAPDGGHRVQHDIEARPRLPVPRANPADPRDYEDDDVGPSLDHAP